MNAMQAAKKMIKDLQKPFSYNLGYLTAKFSSNLNLIFPYITVVGIISYVIGTFFFIGYYQYYRIPIYLIDIKANNVVEGFAVFIIIFIWFKITQEYYRSNNKVLSFIAWIIKVNILAFIVYFVLLINIYNLYYFIFVNIATVLSLFIWGFIVGLAVSAAKHRRNKVPSISAFFIGLRTMMLYISLLCWLLISLVLGYVYGATKTKYSLIKPIDYVIVQKDGNIGLSVKYYNGKLIKGNYKYIDLSDGSVFLSNISLKR